MSGQEQDMFGKASAGSEQPIELSGLTEIVEATEGGENALADAAEVAEVFDDFCRYCRESDCLTRKNMAASGLQDTTILTMIVGKSMPECQKNRKTWDSRGTTF